MHEALDSGLPGERAQRLSPGIAVSAGTHTSASSFFVSGSIYRTLGPATASAWGFLRVSMLTTIRTTALTTSPGYSGSNPFGYIECHMRSLNGPIIAADIPAAGVTKRLKNIAPNNGKSALQPRNPMERKEKPRIKPPKLLLTATTVMPQRQSINSLCTRRVFLSSAFLLI